MYHNGYVETLPVQLPEVQDKIKDYFANHYNHNDLTVNKKEICDDFKQKFIPWLNQGHIKFKGLEKFPYVYIINGVSEFIPTVMTEHNLRPVCVEGEYIAYPAYARVLLKSGIKLDNKIDVISLPFCRTGNIHPETCNILEKSSLVDLAWAGNSGVKETFDLSKVKYDAFSFSKCFGVQYHRIGIAYSKVPIKTLELEAGFTYVNMVGVDLMRHLMSIPPHQLYDKYKNIADKLCKDNGIEPTKHLWIGLKDGKRHSLLEYWMNYLNENGKPRVS